MLDPGIPRLLASAGHANDVLVADGGFPIPAEPERIPVAMANAMLPVVTVPDTLRAIEAEFVIDRIVITTQMEPYSAGRVDQPRDPAASA